MRWWIITGLIGLRGRFPGWALWTAPPRAIQFFSLEQPLVGWTLPAAPETAPGGRRCACSMILRPTRRKCRCRRDSGKLLSDGVSSSLWRGESAHFQGRCTLPGTRHHPGVAMSKKEKIPNLSPVCALYG